MPLWSLILPWLLSTVIDNYDDNNDDDDNNNNNNNKAYIISYNLC
jgi:hypothetical protein